MKTIAYGSNLVQISRFGPFNCYLVREDDGLTLIDALLPRSDKAIRAAAEAQGAPIVRIALTHAHTDHLGSLDALRAALPDVEVLVGAREARIMGGRDKSLDPDEPQAKIKGSYSKVETRPTRELVPGDKVGSLEVVASPGHTPGHIAFFDPRERDLIAGDAFQTAGGIAVAGVIRPLFPLMAFGTWHKPTAIASARALRALDPSRLAVGHGRVLENPGAEMDRAIEEAA
ncbi:MAG: fold metallo-hydrolase [Solirubrobacterales bacterium]|nr:fold metallo-hydrolase [Solirubrobacterales bacterium]